MLEILSQIIEYLRGMWRYRWYALAMTWTVFLLGSFAVFMMPDTYSATARIYVDTENTLRPLMRGLYPDTDMMSEVALMTRAVLFRDNIKEVAIETDLLIRGSAAGKDEETVITDLQRRISVSAGDDENIFTISYSDPSRSKALAVVEAVVDRFLENSLQENRDDKQIASDALQRQIRDSESQLKAKDEERKTFKQENYQFLAGQNSGYYEQMQELDGLIQTTDEELRLLRERRGELERQIKGEAPTFGLLRMGGTVACENDGKIASLEQRLKDLEVSFTDKHPDIVAIRETIADLESQCEANLQAAAEETLDQPYQDPLINNPVYDNLRIELSGTEVKIAETRAMLSNYRSRRADLESKVDKILNVERDWLELNRGYEGMQRYHEELLERQRALETLIGIDASSQGVAFREVDPAFASSLPTGPNRPLLLSTVLIMSLAIGAGLALLLSQMRPVFHSRGMLRRLTGLPVLGSVSLLLTPEQRRKRLLGNIGLTALTAGLFVAFGVVLAISDTVPAAIQTITGVQLL